jgi:hypothetical protein
VHHRPLTHDPSNHFSVIIFNLKEPSSTLLQQREAQDYLAWTSVCKALGLGDMETPILQRLSRGQSTINEDKPRLVKATFKSADCVQQLLLTASTMGKPHLGDVRIRADLTRSERLNRKEVFISNQGSDCVRRRSVILHGIPTSENPNSCLDHETGQWNYIRCKLKVDAIASHIARLPRPAHLSTIKAPRLLRITFVSEYMASQVLEAWHTKRNEFPRDVRIHSDQPRSLRQTLTGGPTQHSPDAGVTVDLIDLTQQQSTATSGLSKNDRQPVC